MGIKGSKRLPYIASLVVILIIIVVVVLIPNQRPDIECYEEEVATMTIQQVSDLLDVSLVELTWLPDNLTSTPKITTRPSRYHPECNITIDYPNPNGSSLPDLVSIYSNALGSIEPTKMPADCSWNFTMSGPTGSDCYLDIDGVATTIRLRMYISPEFSPETILQILDGINVIEPNG